MDVLRLLDVLNEFSIQLPKEAASGVIATGCISNDSVSFNKTQKAARKHRYTIVNNTGYLNANQQCFVQGADWQKEQSKDFEKEVYELTLVADDLITTLDLMGNDNPLSPSIMRRLRAAIIKTKLEQP